MYWGWPGCRSFFGKVLKTTLLYIAIAVSDINEAAKLFSQKGFTLKKPHHYKSGLQEGLTTQSVLLRDGTSLQLVSPKKDKDKKKGKLTQYVKDVIKNGGGGYQIIMHTNSPKKLEKSLNQQQDIPSVRLEEHAQYSWLSFKTESPYAPLSFLKWKKAPQFIDELFHHPNETFGIAKVTLRPQGDPQKWAKIINKSKATQSRLDFSGLMSTGNAFVEKIILKSKLRSVPSSFKVGETTIEFVNESI